MKYIAVNACPISLNGGSTGLAPIHVSRHLIVTNLQNNNFFAGLNLLFIMKFFLSVIFIGFFLIVNTMMIRIAATIASTPPSLDGIDRKIAYANRKYHSGWMCAGVVVILAVLKFSTSPSKFGFIIHRIVIITSSTVKYERSLIMYVL